MPPTVKNLKTGAFNEPMVIFPLSQYEILMEYMEEIEDQLAVIERANEPVVSQKKVDALFKKKFEKK